jgi:hypothetical protein
MHTGSIPVGPTIYSSRILNAAQRTPALQQQPAANESAATQPKVWHFGYSLDIHITL